MPCQVGATVAVALAEGKRGVNQRVLLKTVLPARVELARTRSLLIPPATRPPLPRRPPRFASVRTPSQAFGWIITLVVVGVSTGLLVAQGINAPLSSAKQNDLFDERFESRCDEL
jgi:hypothetical protein